MSVIIFGSKEKDIKSRTDKDNEKEKFIREMSENIAVRPQKIMVVEFHKLGKQEKRKLRPIKVKFQSNLKGDEVIRFARKLNDREENKQVKIGRDQNKENRFTSNTMKQKKEK